MANNTAKTKSAEIVDNPPAQESVYTINELAENHKVFETYREIVVVALRRAGKETYTFAEAKTIIEKFKNKEVR